MQALPQSDRKLPIRPIVALALIAPAPTLGVCAAMIWWPDSIGKAVFIGCKLWMFVWPTIWFLRIEKQRLSLSPARQGGLGFGALMGLLISAAVIGGYCVIGTQLIDAEHVRTMARQNGIGTLPAFLGGAIYWITLNSLLEEYAYRWFIFRQGEKLLGGRAAVFVSALLFTVHHVIALKVQFDWTITILGSAGVFAGGAMWSWLYLKFRSIWPGYISHAIVDVAVFGIGWWLIFGA